MRKIEFGFKSNDGLTMIRGVRYVPDGEIKAILQISHGMQEFIDRYEDFAKYLTEKGYLVVGHDHLGHGESVTSKDNWGYFAEKDGNRVVLDDLHKVTEITKAIYKDKPYFLLGHSMGSFYARQYLIDYGKELDGAVIMGTGHQPKALLGLGKFLIKVIAFFKGWHYRSPLITKMALGANNKRINNPRTPVDWLTRDEKIVDKYLKEPKCTFKFTVNGFYNMFNGMTRLHDKNELNKMPKDLPILFVSGEEDPVGKYGKEVRKAKESFDEIGMKDVSLKLYPNDRHEILNELDKDIVYDDIYHWLESKLPKQ